MTFIKPGNMIIVLGVGMDIPSHPCLSYGPPLVVLCTMLDSLFVYYLREALDNKTLVRGQVGEVST